MKLHEDAAAEVLNFVDTWQPLQTAADPLDAEAVADGAAALEALHAIDWLALCGEQMDDERLRLRNLIEAGLADRQASMQVSRTCEDWCERFEEAVAAALPRFPAQWQQPALQHHLYSAFNNIAGIRLLCQVKTDSFAERLFAAYRSGIIPVGWRGSWPDGRWLAWWQQETS